jgi:hypothetical protein
MRSIPTIPPALTRVSQRTRSRTSRDNAHRAVRRTDQRRVRALRIAALGIAKVVAAMANVRRLAAPRRCMSGATRLLMVVVLLVGLFAMHGLVTPPSAGRAPVASRMVSSSPSVPTPYAAHPAADGMAAGQHRVDGGRAPMPMPMPSGGHPGHDVMDTCLAILTGLAAMALLAAALARRAAARARTNAASPDAWGTLLPLHRPQLTLGPTITTLCISRT